MRRDQRAEQTISRRAAVRSVGGVALGGATLGGIALGALGAAETARAEGGNPPIVGSWLVSADSQGRSVRALVSFFASGIVLWAGSPLQPTHRADDPADAVEHQTISAGEWRQTGFNEYVFSQVGIDYDARGAPIAIDTTRATVTFDPRNDRWTVTFSVTEADVNGTPTGGSFSGTASARRIGATE